MKRIFLKGLKSISFLSLKTATISVNTASAWILHQSKIPQELDQLRITKI